VAISPRLFSISSSFNNRRIVCVGWGLYAALAAFIFIWAGAIRFHLPLFPLVDKDIPGYLNPALSKLAGLGYIHDHGRHFVYPGLVYLLLRIFGDFRAITIFQHGIGLMTGGLLLLTWERAGRLLGKARVSPWLYRALGLILTATFLTATKPILYEVQIRAESEFAFVAILSLLLNVEFIRLRFVERNAPDALPWGISALFVAALLHCLRPTWGIGFIFASLPAVISLFEGSETIRRKCILAGVSITLVTAFLILPERSLAKEDRGDKTFGARVVFATHADFIRDQIGIDLAQGAAVPYDKEWLASVQASLTEDIEMTAPEAQKTLGFNSEFIMWEDSTFRKITHDMGNDPEKVSAFCWYYYKRVIVHQPWRMTKKVLFQMGQFYTVPNPVYQKSESEPIALTEDYGRSAELLAGYTKHDNAWPGVRVLASGTELARTARAAIPSNRWLSALHRPLAFAYLPGLVIDVLLSAWIFLVPRWRRQLGAFALFSLLVYSYNFGNCLTIAIVHILVVRRYLFAQLVFTLMAQFLTLALIWKVSAEVAKECICRLRLRATRSHLAGMESPASS